MVVQAKKKIEEKVKPYGVATLFQKFSFTMFQSVKLFVVYDLLSKR